PAPQPANLLALLHVPQQQRRIGPRQGQVPAVGAEGQVEDHTDGGPETIELLPGGDIPQLDLARLAREREIPARGPRPQSATGTESRAQHALRVCGEAPHLAPGFGIPDPRLARPPAAAALVRRGDLLPARRQKPAIGTEGNPFRLVVDLQLLPAGVRVPHSNGAVETARAEAAVATELEGP